MCSHFMATSPRRNVLRGCRFGFLQHRATRKLMKSLAQILQGTVDARSDSVEFAAEKSGNFLIRSEEHTSELQSQSNLVCRLLLEKKKKDAVLVVHSRQARL